MLTLSPLGTLSHLVRLDATKRTVAWYRANLDRLDRASEGSLHLNLGWGQGPIPAAQERMAAQMAQGLASGRWLDVGSGLGGPARQWLAADPELHVTGLELVPELLERSRTRPHERFRQLGGDADSMPFGPEFDAVLALDSVCHVRDRAQFCRQAWRALKPQGVLRLTDLACKHEALRLTDANVVAATRLALGAHALSSTQRWTSNLRDAGFEDILIKDVTADRVDVLEAWRLALGGALGRTLGYLHERRSGGPVAMLLVQARKA